MQATGWRLQSEEDFRLSEQLGRLAQSGRLKDLRRLATPRSCCLRNRRGWTPLMRAAMNNQTASAAHLLALGSDVHARSDFGWTALHWAAYNGYVGVARLLLVSGADVDDTRATCWTPLMLAASQAKLDVLQLLLNYSASIAACDRQGNTAERLAEVRRHSAVCELLDNWRTMNDDFRQRELVGEQKASREAMATLAAAKKSAAKLWKRWRESQQDGDFWGSN